MPRKGKRQHLESGIARDDTGFSVRVSVGSGPQRRTRERRFPPTYRWPEDAGYLRAQRATLEADLRDELQQRDPDAAAGRGTWAGDVRAYLKRVKPTLDKATYRGRVSELKAWTRAISRRPRHHLRKTDMQRIVNDWHTTGVAPKTILNRVRSFKHLYVVLDGTRAKTPADEVTLPKVVRVRPRDVDVKTVRTVVANLIRQERRGRLRTAKTRARFLLRITTGQRPVQIMKTNPARDFDLERRIWMVPTAKGGNPTPLYLNDDMRLACALFIAAKAQGRFDTTSQARVLRRAGWPADIPIYNARHTVGIAFSERGEDLADIQAWMGHRHIQTTRDFYVPRLFSRMKAMSERADRWVKLSQRGARFAGTPTKPRAKKRFRRRT